MRYIDFVLSQAQIDLAKKMGQDPAKIAANLTAKFGEGTAEQRRNAENAALWQLHNPDAPWNKKNAAEDKKAAGALSGVLTTVVANLIKDPNPPVKEIGFFKKTLSRLRGQKVPDPTILEQIYLGIDRAAKNMNGPQKLILVGANRLFGNYLKKRKRADAALSVPRRIRERRRVVDARRKLCRFADAVAMKAPVKNAKRKRVERRIRQYADKLFRRVDVVEFSNPGGGQHPLGMTSGAMNERFIAEHVRRNKLLEKLMAFLRRAFSGAKKGLVRGDVFKKIAASLQKLANNATDTRTKRAILAITSSVLIMASAAGAAYLLRNKFRDLLLNLYDRFDIHSQKGREMLKDYVVFSKKYQQGVYPELQSKQLDSATSEFLQAYSSYKFPEGVKVDGKAADRVYNSVIDIQRALRAKVKVPQLDMAMYAADRTYEEYIERALGGAGNMDILVPPEENSFQKSYKRLKYLTK